MYKKINIILKQLVDHRFANQRGGVLLMLLILIPVFSMGALAAYYYSQNRAETVYYSFHSQQAGYVAEAGLQRLIAEIENNPAFLETLDTMVLGDLIIRYGKEGAIQFFGADNPDIVAHSAISHNGKKILAGVLELFSLSQAHAVSYGTGATYKIRLTARDLNDPLNKRYTFEAMARTYPTDAYPDADNGLSVVEEKKVTMEVEVTNKLTPPPPPPYDSTTTCQQSSNATGCKTQKTDGFYRYSFYAGNNIAHSGITLGIFGTNAPLTYHSGNKYNSRTIKNGTCLDINPLCNETDDTGRTGLKFMNCDCLFGVGTYGCNECIEAETDVVIDCPLGAIFVCTGFRGTYYGNSSFCADHSPSPVVAFEDVVGPAYGTGGTYNLASVKRLVIEKVTNGKVTDGDASSLKNGWNTGEGLNENYHYWKSSDGSDLSDFNFFNTDLLNKENNVYYIENSLKQFNLTGADIDLLNVLSSGSVTIIAERDINLKSVGAFQFDFAAEKAASLHLIAGNNINHSQSVSTNFIIGQASEINLIALNDITIEKGIEFNFSFSGHSGMHVVALHNLTLKDGLEFSFGWNETYYNSKYGVDDEPTYVEELCDTTGSISDDPDADDSAPGQVDVNVISVDIGKG